VTKDYSALDEGDTIKSIAVSPYYLYRLEARERGTNGGIFVAPQNYRLMILFCRIKLMKGLVSVLVHDLLSSSDTPL